MVSASVSVEFDRPETKPGRPGLSTVSRSRVSSVESLSAEDDRSERIAWERLVFRVRREFEEMPGLCITIAQAARLFGLPEEKCRRVLACLEADAVLRCTARGMWVLCNSRA